MHNDYNGEMNDHYKQPAYIPDGKEHHEGEDHKDEPEEHGEYYE